MKTVLACLNLIVERGVHCEVDPNHARLAIHAIETQSLMAGALRLILANPKDKSALDHGAKLLDLHDKYTAKHSAPVVAEELAPAKPVPDQDVADLV